MGLFLGETIVARSGGQLGWVYFDKGKRDVAFHRPVLMGFSRVANPNYNVDPEGTVSMLAHSLLVHGLQADSQPADPRLVARPVQEGHFLRVVQHSVEHA
jgi:hypothetical protein